MEDLRSVIEHVKVETPIVPDQFSAKHPLSMAFLLQDVFAREGNWGEKIKLATDVFNSGEPRLIEYAFQLAMISLPQCSGENFGSGTQLLQLALQSLEVPPDAGSSQKIALLEDVGLKSILANKKWSAMTLDVLKNRSDTASSKEVERMIGQLKKRVGRQ